MKLVAVFSSSATGAMVAITPAADPYRVVALTQCSSFDRPLDVLASLGYKLAHRDHRHSLGSTMDKTTYAKLFVVPV